MQHDHPTLTAPARARMIVFRAQGFERHSIRQKCVHLGQATHGRGGYPQKHPSDNQSANTNAHTQSETPKESAMIERCRSARLPVRGLAGLLRLQLQRYRVHAIAQPTSVPWAVVEHMAQVRAAA